VGLEEILGRPDLKGTRWSVQVRDAETGAVVAGHASDRLLRTASVAKVFLLLEVAELLERGELAPDRPLRRDAVAPVADSGLWQHLTIDVLPVEDAAILVAAVSDNWATNALVDLVGLSAVRDRARRTVAGGSTLHDLVRDVRTPADPPTLSEGCAADWAGLFAGLHAGSAASRGACRRVLGWLRTSTDLSMVAAGFGLDPLAHAVPDRGVSLWNKTGTSDGVRADVGLVHTARATLSYAVLCNWDPADASLREPVLAAMRELGSGIARLVGAPTAI
jgi:beta-lactamase class A